MDAHDVRLAELHGAWMALAREMDLLRARMHDNSAEQDDLRGDTHGAAWHRAQAKAERSDDPSDRAEAHRLWVVCIAHAHLRNGTVPETGDHCSAEVEAEMDRIRGAQTAA